MDLDYLKKNREINIATQGKSDDHQVQICPFAYAAKTPRPKTTAIAVGRRSYRV